MVEARIAMSAKSRNIVYSSATSGLMTDGPAWFGGPGVAGWGRDAWRNVFKKMGV